MPSNTRQLIVPITPHFSKFIQDKVKSGRYSNASEVVREALRRWEQKELVSQQSTIADPHNFEEEVLQGLRSIERGNFTELDTEEDLKRYFAGVGQRGKKLMTARKRAARGEALLNFPRGYRRSGRRLGLHRRPSRRRSNHRFPLEVL